MKQPPIQTPRRRRAKGAAWYWRQTDAWYYTPPGTKKRVPLFDARGRRIRGPQQKQAADLALARRKVDGQWRPTAAPSAERAQVLVARVCSDYLQYCERGVAGGSISADHRATAVRCLNDLSAYCGALPVPQLTKEHVRLWIDGHPSWRSPATVRNCLAVVLAAFNLAEETHELHHPLHGLKKPPARPRLHSLTAADETALLGAAGEPFRQFLFAALHTGLRPFCELARLTVGDVLETERGMMWRVYSSKTKKTRKIPIRQDVADLVRPLLQGAQPAALVFRNPRWSSTTTAASGASTTRNRCGRRSASPQ